MLSGLLGRALRLSPKNTTSLSSISSRLSLPSHRGLHQLLHLKHSAPICTPFSTRPSSSYFSRFFSDAASGRSQPIGNCKPVLKQQQQTPRFFSSNGSAHWQQPDAQQLPVLSPPAVGNWLLLSSTLVIAVIVVGGITRLTESGLSITEWRPITGVLPPLSLTEWEDEFEKYKATPEFRLCVLPFRFL
jgi:cytochrome c oxidase assembly protein subunit 15